MLFAQWLFVFCIAVSFTEVLSLKCHCGAEIKGHGSEDDRALVEDYKKLCGKEKKCTSNHGCGITYNAFGKNSLTAFNCADEDDEEEKKTFYRGCQTTGNETICLCDKDLCNTNVMLKDYLALPQPSSKSVTCNCECLALLHSGGRHTETEKERNKQFCPNGNPCTTNGSCLVTILKSDDFEKMVLSMCDNSKLVAKIDWCFKEADGQKTCSCKNDNCNSEQLVENFDRMKFPFWEKPTTTTSTTTKSTTSTSAKSTTTTSGKSTSSISGSITGQAIEKSMSTKSGPGGTGLYKSSSPHGSTSPSPNVPVISGGEQKVDAATSKSIRYLLSGNVSFVAILFYVKVYFF